MNLATSKSSLIYAIQYKSYMRIGLRGGIIPLLRVQKKVTGRDFWKNN